MQVLLKLDWGKPWQTQYNESVTWIAAEYLLNVHHTSIRKSFQFYCSSMLLNSKAFLVLFLEECLQEKKTVIKFYDLQLVLHENSLKLTLYKGRQMTSMNPTCICGNSSFLSRSIIAWKYEHYSSQLHGIGSSLSSRQVFSSSRKFLSYGPWRFIFIITNASH
jgi:hypothetical protein